MDPLRILEWRKNQRSAAIRRTFLSRPWLSDFTQCKHYYTIGRFLLVAYGWFLLSVCKERYGVNRPIYNIGFHAIGISIVYWNPH